MKFSLITILACVGSAFAAPATSANSMVPVDIQGILQQLPAIINALQGSTGNTTLPVARARSVETANNVKVGQVPPVELAQIQSQLPAIVGALQESAQNGTVAAARVRRATATTGIDISGILSQLPGVIGALQGQAPGNSTNPQVPSIPNTPTAGGSTISGILEKLPGVITALQGAQMVA